VLAGPATLDAVAVATSVPGVSFVGAGQAVPNPSALLARRHDFVNLARRASDVVVLDGPPLAQYESAELVGMADAVVVACRSGQTTAKAATQATELLGVLGAPPSGVVLEQTPGGRD